MRTHEGKGDRRGAQRGKPSIWASKRRIGGEAKAVPVQFSWMDRLLPRQG